MNWFYYVGRWATRGVMLLTRCEVTGRQNVPQNGPLLIVSNHISVADPPLIGVCVNRKMVFMAKEELFASSLMAYFIGGYGAFPVRRSGVDLAAFRKAEECLERGLALVMFPEGSRSKTGMKAGLAGSALVAVRKNVPILPIGITGTEHIKGKWWWLRRPRIRINIGEPFRLGPSGDRAELEKQTREMMERIAALVPPEYRGKYGDNPL